MFPMVTTAGEARAALDLVASERCSLAAEGAAVPSATALETGIMIEVPAAALTATRLAEIVDFFSVDTDDLTQYTMAADRQLSSVAGLGDALHPAVLTLIARTAAAAAGAGRWTGVCGELAADPLAVPLLLGLGVRELSVSAASVGTVKEAVRATNLACARELATLPAWHRPGQSGKWRGTGCQASALADAGPRAGCRWRRLTGMTPRSAACLWA
jgi:phosphoenolpyruvate-protein kinase (PTS system EI component)